jgi:hypothetical protein
MLGYCGSWERRDKEIVWRDADEFVATMQLNTTTRGRSAATFHWEDKDGNGYEMFLSETESLLKRVVLDHGLAYGRWTFVKRGANYSLSFVGPE